MDQAGTLRKLMNNRVAIRPSTMRPVRVISVTSGKGGVGKTNVVANLGIQLQKAGKKVLMLDGDFGLANLNIILGLEANHSIHDVLDGTKEFQDIIVQGPHGIKVIPSSSGIFRMTQLSMAEKTIVMERLEATPIQFDILLIDTGAGINSDVAYLNAAATEVIVVATPEPTSIADAYALMKVMSQNYKVKTFKLIVNMVDSSKEAFGVYSNLLNVTDKFLNVKIEYLGHVLEDRKVSQSVVARKAVSDAWPQTAASQCFESIAQTLRECPATGEVTGNLQFFWRTLLQEQNGASL